MLIRNYPCLIFISFPRAYRISRRQMYGISDKETLRRNGNCGVAYHDYTLDPNWLEVWGQTVKERLFRILELYCVQ